MHESATNQKPLRGWRSLPMVLLVVMAISSCEPTPQKHLRRAKGLVISGSNLEKAESLLKSVLDEQPQNFEARRQLAEVYRQRDQYRRAEEQLKALWKAGGFETPSADEGGRRRTMKTLLNEQLVQLYREWATLLDEQGKTDEMVEVCRRGLAFDPTQATLNRLLVDHYWERAQRLVEEGKKEAAADAYSEILTLRTEPDDSRRQTARSRVTELRDEAFNERVRASFRSEVIPTLGEIEAVTLEDETLTVDFLTTVDRRLDPDEPEGAQQIRREALLKLMDIIAPRIIMPVTGLPDEADATVVSEAKRLELLKQHLKDRTITFVPGGAVVKGRIPVAAIVPMARTMREAYLAVKQRETNEAAGAADAGFDVADVHGQRVGRESE